MNMLVSLVNVNHTVTSKAEDFNNQMNGVNYLVDISQDLSLVTLIIA